MENGFLKAKVQVIQYSTPGCSDEIIFNMKVTLVDEGERKEDMVHGTQGRLGIYLRPFKGNN